MSTTHHVVFSFNGTEYHLTLAEATDLQGRIRNGIDALLVKCPTCRCRIMPGSECGCCKWKDVFEDEEPFI